MLFREARTAHSFSGGPVTDEQVQAIHDLVKCSPTAFNQSPLRVTLARTPEAREGLVRRVAEGNRAKPAAATLVGVRAAGLAAGPMTGYDAAGLRVKFLDGDHEPLTVVNVCGPGPDAWFPRSPRLPYGDVVTTV
ncbi:nitroreductase family protein [Streptomyces sp. CC224B]|uniref:nitroreductase family protein n=1 Tax=Streptomyces sp. CC224B TaxID=3044571 RepID=UPI0024A8DD59|nr:nitroreductase family protein [Streptomyces sp. CC224B]